MKQKDLFKKLEKTLDAIERSEDTLATLAAILKRLVDDFQHELGLTGGRIYVRENDSFVLRTEYPETASNLGFRIPLSYAPIQELLREGFVLYVPGDPGFDLAIEESLGVETFAAIRVGIATERIMAFSIEESPDHERVIYTLNTIRHLINLKLRKERLDSRVAEVQAIQGSLLPAKPPAFDGYDLWAVTRPAEEVGGDLYDFLPVSKRLLGIAIADSAGHGLPAALQARDAIIGLRMGVEDRLRITATIEKLNRVINHSALASRFISMFYGEIEPNGNLVYCNAGHNPPLLYRDGEFHELRQGGIVLGPHPSARYERGYIQMEPGSILLMYTDGIVEAADGNDLMFGTERLMKIIRAKRWLSARELVEEIFAAVKRFSTADPPLDDQTLVAMIRLEES
jgi:sigma-B regulation protein RsbU (phosphoserine phosphatase)